MGARPTESGSFLVGKTKKGLRGASTRDTPDSPGILASNSGQLERMKQQADDDGADYDAEGPGKHSSPPWVDGGGN